METRFGQWVVYGGLVAGMLLAGPHVLDAQEEDEIEGGDTIEAEMECQLEGGDRLAEAEQVVNNAVEAEDEAEAEPGFREALEITDEVLEEDEESAAGHWLAGRARVGLSDYEQADEHLDRFVELEPGCMQQAEDVRSRAWVELYNEGIRGYQEGDEEQALESFSQANRIHDDARSLFNAALLYQQNGDLERAEETYRRTLEVSDDPEQMENATVNLGELLRGQGRSEEADELYQQYIADNPEAVLPRINYADVLLETEREDSARAVITGLLDREDLDFREWFNVGVGLLRVGAHEEAQSAFEEARTLEPYEKAAMQNQMDATMAAGDFQRAAQIGDTLMNWYPYEPAHFRSLAQAHDQLGQTQQVQQTLQVLEGLELEFLQVEMIERGENNYVVRGQATSEAAAGQTVSVPFEFLNEEGEVVATSEAEIDLPAQGETAAFEMQVTSDQPLAGFRYQRL